MMKRLAFFLAVLAGTAQADPLPKALTEGADVVFFGEIHDNPRHHLNQLDWLRALAPKAVVFEMLTPAQAASVAGPGHAAQAELEKALDWANSGWPDFTGYYPLIAYAAKRQIFGAQIPRGALRQAMVEGDLPGLLGDDAERFGLTRPLADDVQATREADQMAAHCNALPETMLPGMVMAQRVRDAALARAVVDALSRSGGPVAVIAGNGHARTDWGVPRVLGDGIAVVSIAQFEEDPGDDVPYDHFVVTAPHPREDPCNAFK